MSNNFLSVPSKSPLLRIGLAFFIIITISIFVAYSRYVLAEDLASFYIGSFFVTFPLFFLLSLYAIKKPFSSASKTRFALGVRRIMSFFKAVLIVVGLSYYILEILGSSLISLELDKDTYLLSSLVFLILYGLEIYFSKRGGRIYFSLLIWSILLSASVFLLPIIGYGLF